MLEDILEEFCVPNDHSRQVTPISLVECLLLQNSNIETVLDLGCGTGNSVDFFRSKNPQVRWIGLDIENSPEAAARGRNDASFVAFDGSNIPFNDNCFDLIYCKQVLEHVRSPTKLLKEVHRVLKRNGYFVGSTSHLEAYHSFSLWNFTPYGLRLLIEDAGLQFVEIRPSIDGPSLIIRQIIYVLLSRLRMKRPKYFFRWWDNESPLNRIITLAGKLSKKDHRTINSVKLLFCGQFCFLIKKGISHSVDKSPFDFQNDRQSPNGQKH